MPPQIERDRTENLREGFENTLVHAAARLLVTAHGKDGPVADKMRSLAARLQVLAIEGVEGLPTSEAAPARWTAGAPGDCRDKSAVLQAAGLRRRWRRPFSSARAVKKREYRKPTASLSV